MTDEVYLLPFASCILKAVLLWEVTSLEGAQLDKLHFSYQNQLKYHSFLMTTHDLKKTLV